MQKQPFLVRGGGGGGRGKKFEDWGVTELWGKVGTSAGGEGVSTPLHAMLS